MSDAVPARPLPLDGLHREVGCAAWEHEGGYRVPEHYGSPGAEAAALDSGVALYDGSAWGRVEILGADARRLVNGFCTADVRALAADELAYGLITGPKGHILADVTFACHADRLWLRLPPGRGRLIREHLGKYVIAEDVELLPMRDLIPIWLFGRQVGERLQQAGVEPPELRRHGRTTAWGTEVEIEHGCLLGVPGICLSVSASIAEAFAGEVRDRLDAAWLGRRALESARINDGAPRWGVDFDDDTLPQEAGLNAAVDYEKGCYLGQEVVARLHYRGREQRRLFVVEVEAPGSLPAEVTAGGAEVGSITSLDPLSDEHFPATGIAMLKRGAVEGGRSLTTPNSGSVTVIRYVAVDGFGMPDPEAAETVASSGDASSDWSQEQI